MSRAARRLAPLKPPSGPRGRPLLVGRSRPRRPRPRPLRFARRGRSDAERNARQQGCMASQDSGPTSRILLRRGATNARTSRGSNCLPEQRTSSPALHSSSPAPCTTATTSARRRRRRSRRCGPRARSARRRARAGTRSRPSVRGDARLLRSTLRATRGAARPAPRHTAGAGRLPLLVRGLARLVEDLPPDLELPDVVEERRPVETVELVVVEPELLAEHVAVRSHALRVTPRDGTTLSSREAQEDLRRFLRRKRPFFLAGPRRSSSDSTVPVRRASSNRDGASSGRRATGREVPPEGAVVAQPVAERHDDRGGRADRDPPEEEHPQRCRRRLTTAVATRTNASDTAIEYIDALGGRAHSRARGPAMRARALCRSHDLVIGAEGVRLDPSIARTA